MSHKNTLSPSSIVRIIGICSESGVREFALGDLRISFFGGGKADVAPVVFDDAAGDDIEREAVQLDVALSREDQLDLMKVEDPLSWEKQFTEGELLHAESVD